MQQCDGVLNDSCIMVLHDNESLYIHISISIHSIHSIHWSLFKARSTSLREEDI